MKRCNLIFVLVAFLIIGCEATEKPPGGSGLLEARETLISAETQGRVINMFFSEGMSVGAGDTLAIIDPSRLELQLSAAVAGRKVAVAQRKSAVIETERADIALAYAKQELERVTRLKGSGTATEKAFDKSEFEWQQAQIEVRNSQALVASINAKLESIDAGIAIIERQLSDCYLWSPTSGVVTEQFVEQGELLAPGKPVIRLARLDTLEVKVYLGAGEFARIKIGDKATVDTETGAAQIEAIVVWTSEEAEFTPKNVQTQNARANLVFAVKLVVPNNDGTLKIGMPVYVSF